jgi:hypothetical protein
VSEQRVVRFLLIVRTTRGSAEPLRSREANLLVLLRLISRRTLAQKQMFLSGHPLYMGFAAAANFCGVSVYITILTPSKFIFVDSNSHKIRAVFSAGKSDGLRAVRWTRE